MSFQRVFAKAMIPWDITQRCNLSELFKYLYLFLFWLYLFMFVVVINCHKQVVTLFQRRLASKPRPYICTPKSTPVNAIFTYMEQAGGGGPLGEPKRYSTRYDTSDTLIDSFLSPLALPSLRHGGAGPIGMPNR